MRMRRLLVHHDQPIGYYHCVSRVVNPRGVIDDLGKTQLVGLLHECEAFCGVQVLSFCVLPDLFQVLVAVPQPLSAPPSEEEVLGRIGTLSRTALTAEVARERLDEFRAARDEAGAAAFLQSIWSRFNDIGEFMKLVKQRFTQWHNRQHHRRGTLWEQRFKSTLVEGAGPVLLAVSGYIDFGPVRTGLVQDPKDYPWCSYGEAMAGKERALQGIQTIAEAILGHSETPTRSLELYQKKLALREPGTVGVDAEGSPGRSQLDPEAAKKVLQSRGSVPLQAYLRSEVRYFEDGMVLGTREFVDRVFQQNRKRFGPKRQSGAHRMRGVELNAGEPELCVMRNLQLRVFGETPEPRDPDTPGEG